MGPNRAQQVSESLKVSNSDSSTEISAIQWFKVPIFIVEGLLEFVTKLSWQLARLLENTCIFWLVSAECQKIVVKASTVSELLRENQQGSKITPPTQIRVNKKLRFLISMFSQSWYMRGVKRGEEDIFWKYFLIPCRMFSFLDQLRHISFSK